MSRTAKAIVVTDANKAKLVEQYKLDEDYLDDAIGLWLIVGFGEETLYQGLLTKTGFEKIYEKTGVTLNNGYIEVQKPGGGPS